MLDVIEERIRAHLGYSTQCSVNYAEGSDGGSNSLKLKVNVQSDSFCGIPSINRHRMVYAALSEWLEDGTIHAIEIIATTHSNEAEK